MADAGLLSRKQKLTVAKVQENLQTVLGAEADTSAAMASLGLSAAIEGQEHQTVQLTTKKLQEAVATGVLTEAQAQELAMRTGVMLSMETQAATTLPTWIANMKAMTLATWKQIKATVVWLATNPAGWAAATVAGIAVLTVGMLKFCSSINVTLKEQKEKLKETKEAWEDVKNELQEVETRLQNNIDRIKELEGLSNLTWVEQAELDRLREVTKELELQKKIKQDEQLDKAEDLYKENVETFNKEFGSSVSSSSVYNLKQILYSGNASVIQLDLENNLVDIEAMLQYLTETKDKLTDASEIQDYEEEIAKLTQTKRGLIKNMAENKGLETLSSISEYKQNILEIASVRELTEDEQNFYDYLTSLQKMIYETYDPATWNSLEFDSIFDTDGIEKTKEELIALQKAGELSPEVLESYQKLREAIERSGIIAGEESDVFKEFYNEIAALADKQADIIEDDFEEIIPTISSSISTIATQLEPQFTELGKLYNEIFQTDDNGNEIFSLDSIDNAALESLRKSFADTGEEIGVTFDPAQLEPFFTILTDGSSTADEVQQTFNDLATAYLYSTGTLEQLNNETANAIEKQLEQMGVTNAEAVVAEALALKNEELALSRKYLAQEGKELASATDSEVLAFMAEQAEADNCGKKLAALQLQKLLVNGTLLDTEADINNVMSLAKSAGIATEALSELIRWKTIYEKAEANGYSLASSFVADHIEALKQNFQDEVNSLKFNHLGIEYKISDSSKSSSSSSSAAKQAETDWKNLLDKETDLLEKQLAANVITFKEYTDKRRQIIEDYYRDGKIKAEDYYDALEDMYDHQLSLYNRVVNAVTNRIDDEIDKLKDQKEAIENSYQAKIDAIQEEIDALNKANDARKAQIDLEKAQYEAARARNQRVNRTYDGSQFVYATDMEAVRDAEDNLADQKTQISISRLEAQIESLEKEMENATKGLDSQIEALESYKEKWNEISDVYQKQQDKLLAAEIMGAEWECDILNGRLDTLQSFTEQYIALQQAQADAAVNAARIKAEAEAGNASGGNTGDNDGGNGGEKYEVVYEGTAKIVRTFDSKQDAQNYVNRMNKGIADDDFIYYIKNTKKYASGTDNARKGLNLVGEDGTETFIDNDGNVSLVTKPTLIPMEGGEVVKNAEETKAMLDTGNLEPMQEEQSAEMKSLLHSIKNMPFSDFNFKSIIKPLETAINLPNIDFSPVLSGSESINIVQNNTINCPNVTNSSGAEYIMKELKRLPLDTIQFSHRRHK